MYEAELREAEVAKSEEEATKLEEEATKLEEEATKLEEEAPQPLAAATPDATAEEVQIFSSE